MTSREAVRLPRIARPRTLLAFVAVVVVVGAAGVLLGASMGSTGDLDEVAAEAPPSVEATVERRALAPTRSIQGAVDAGDTQTVAFAGVVAPAVLPYVTEVGAGPGAALANGGLLIAVAGRPRIALRTTAPLYRDLRVGDVGSDVESFETALKAAVGGDFDVDETFTTRTLAAAAQLWEERGYELPTEDAEQVDAPAVSTGASPAPGASAAPTPVMQAREPYIDVTQIVQLPTDTVDVVSVLQLGDTATADAPLATLRTSPRRIVARANVVDAEEFPPGAAVVLRSAGRPEQQAQVGRLGEFVASDDSAQSAAGRDVVVDLPAEWSDLSDGSLVGVSTVQAGEPVLAVPLTAVHDASSAPFVVVARASGFEPDAEVPVEVLESGGGWVRIDESAGLVEGDSVLVSP